MNYNCIILDDEKELADMTREYFEMFGISCAVSNSAAEYKEFIKDNTADVILMDINLGDDSGFTLCKEIREKSEIPIIFISARQSDDDVLIALNIGGDDYVKKPYSLSVLLAKVKLVLKKLKKTTVTSELLTDEKNIITLIPDTMRVKVKGQEIHLKAREYKLLAYLFNNRNKIVTKEELFQNVWGDNFFSDGTLNVHIRKIREKIETNPNEPEYIKTIWGTGYMLEL